MLGREWVVTTTRVGSLVVTGDLSPRCMSVVDAYGRSLAGLDRVDMRTAVSGLNAMLREAGRRAAEAAPSS